MNSCTVPSGTFMYKDSPYERSRVRLKKKTIYLATKLFFRRVCLLNLWAYHIRLVQCIEYFVLYKVTKYIFISHGMLLRLT